MNTNKIEVIAEIGVNHDGSIEKAKHLVDCAKKAGADTVKFQTFSASSVASKYATKVGYQRERTHKGGTQLEMLSSLQLSLDEFRDLFEYCKQSEILFLSTAFDDESLSFLVDLGVSRLKIPSGEITNLPYLQAISDFGLPVILSTGMSTLLEVEQALEVLTEKISLDRIVVLHCTSEYPAPMENINLRAMATLRDTFNVCVGYSDHTQGIEVAVAAAGLGAKIIEKHITLDRNDVGPDHFASTEPEEFENMICMIRNIEVAMGSSTKRPSNTELETLKHVRKSIVASKAISKGEKFTAENLAVKRPGTGISPAEYFKLLGTRSDRDYAVDQLIIP